MSQFFGQQQLAAQYFRPQYLHGAGGAPVQDGRSGYWRMFYYQLQEEELKKHEQKQGQKAAQGTVESTGKDAPRNPVPKPRKLTPTQKSSNAQTPGVVPPVTQKKLYIVPKRQEQMDVAPLLKSISNDLTAWALHSQELSVKFQSSKRQEQLDKAFQSANDDEETITWLLLAA